MAVDKNSKAYQDLTKSGYSDEQIGQMHERTLNGESARDVIGSTPAANKNENQQSQTIMTDPIAYRPEYNNGMYDKYIEGWDPTKLNNADINITQYGDDSSAKNYNNSALWGGENQKYTGENTLGSQIAYNPNATLEGLDPNYLYGQAAQMQNSKQANYIATRNDEIASALYNAGKTSVQDVADFLSKQNQWDYSNENERQNTIQSVWKRIGQIAEMNGQPENPENPEEPNDPLKNMEEDLLKSRAGELYGKVTADANQPVVTLEDANSVYKAMNESRINAFKNLQTADPNALAAAIVSGSIAYDSQSMRDLMQYDPAKYQEIKNAEKQLRGQMNVNAISSGEGELTTTATNGQSGLSNEIADFASNNSTVSTSTADLLKSVNSSLDSNTAATTASEQMANIEADMATLNNRLKNLKSEANKIFKGDVPQYIVNAYIANRTAEIQDQLSILENRYNAAYSRYQQEWEQTKWNAEYNLKLEELALKKQSMALEKYATEQGIAIDWYKAMGSSASTSTSTTLNGNTVQTTTLSREEIGASIDSLVNACTNGQLGNAQCAAGIQKYYLPTLGVDLGSLSAYSAKQGICNRDTSYTPQKGDIVVMSSPTKPENGHMGIVIGVEGNTLKYLDWNGSIGSDGKGTEKAEIRTTKLSNSRIYGYYDPTYGQGKSSGGYYDPAYADIYGKYLQGKFAAGKQLQTQAAAMGLTEQQLDAQARAWKASQNDNEEVQSRLHAIEQVLNMAGNNRMGRLISDWGPSEYIRSGYADFNSAYQFIRDNITFDKLLDLKKNGATFGALSDNELRAIGNAAVNLSKKMSNEEFQQQLTWIYNKLLKGIGEENYNLTTQEIKNRYKPGGSTTTTTTGSTSRGNTNRNNNQNGGGMTAEEKAKAAQGF